MTDADVTDARDRELAADPPGETDRRLDDLAEHAAQLVSELDDLGTYLALVEMTPEQFDYLASALGDIGLAGGAILVADAARTSRRETAELRPR